MAVGGDRRGQIRILPPHSRDRDQAFVSTIYLLLGIARGTAPDIKKLMIFKGKDQTHTMADLQRPAF